MHGDSQSLAGPYMHVHMYGDLVGMVVSMIVHGLLFFSHTIRHGRLETVKYLIEEQGCSAGGTDWRGSTPLHEACW